MKDHEYGLLLETVNRYGTEYIQVTVARREPDKEHPLGCPNDGEIFADSGCPKHLLGLALDGLMMCGFISDIGVPHFIEHDVEFRDVYSSDQRKLTRMLKAIKRVNAQIAKDHAYEPGDKLMSFAKALKLSFVVERMTPRGSYGQEWRWMSVLQGRERYRNLIATKVFEATTRKKETA